MIAPSRPAFNGPIFWYMPVHQPRHISVPLDCIYSQGGMTGALGSSAALAGCGPGSQIEIGGKIIHLGMFLGKGSFGTVYEADIPGDNQKYALKILPEFTSKQRRNNKTEVNNLLTANAKGGADHNIVRFYEQFMIKGTLHCILVERLGQSLADLMAIQRKPLHFLQIIRIARQVMCAVAHMNSVGICHTDIKAANVLVDPRLPFLFSVKLADLGNAMPLCRLEKDFPVNAIQSVAYRAPEVYLGLELTCRIDVWSIGCLLAEMYIGKIIFPAENCHQLALFHYELVGLPHKYWLGKDYSKYYKVDQTVTGRWLHRPYSVIEMHLMGLNPFCDIRDYRLTTMVDLYICRHRKGLLPVHRSERKLLDMIKKLLNPTPSERPTPKEALELSLFY